MNLKTVGKISIGIGAFLILYSFTFKKKSKSKSVLFVGDSMTTTQDKNGVEVDGSYNYPNLIRRMKISGLDIDTLAIAGKTTDWMKQELPNKIKSKKYDDVYIYGGTNDIFRGSEINKVVDNIQNMVDMSIQQGAKPHVIIGYNTSQAWEENLLNPIQWGLKNKEDILKIKQKYINYQDALKNGIKNAELIFINMGKGTTYDGVHPNLEGNKIISETIFKSLDF